MKKTIIGVLLLLCLVASCAQKTDIWQSATYTEDAELGEGAKTVMVQVVAGERAVNFTINTDAQMLGDALLEHDLISGDAGPYGLYVKVVNGMVADYDIDGTYWAFTKNGESLTTGVDNEVIEDRAHYEIMCIE